jgi:hypothetical protein
MKVFFWSISRLPCYSDAIVTHFKQDKTMQAIEFEATAFEHTVRIPETIPDGVVLRFLVLIDDAKIQNTDTQKNLIAAMPNVGTDEDFERPLEYGREQSWDI